VHELKGAWRQPAEAADGRAHTGRERRILEQVFPSDGGLTAARTGQARATQSASARSRCIGGLPRFGRPPSLVCECLPRPDRRAGALRRGQLCRSHGPRCENRLSRVNQREPLEQTRRRGWRMRSSTHRLTTCVRERKVGHAGPRAGSPAESRWRKEEGRPKRPRNSSLERSQRVPKPARLTARSFALGPPDWEPLT
jgi:hypothetical protein